MFSDDEEQDGISELLPAFKDSTPKQPQRRLWKVCFVQFTNMLEGHFLWLDRLFTVTLGTVLIVLAFVLVSPFTQYKLLPWEYSAPGNWKNQLAQISFLLSYFSHDLLALRIVLTIASFWLTFWAGSFSPMPLMDTTLWNLAFMLINVRMAGHLVYEKRPIHFSPDLELVYRSVFRGIMSRSQFQALTKGAVVRNMPAGRFYAQAGDSIHGLAFLFKGTIQIIKPSAQTREAISQVVEIQESELAGALKEQEGKETTHVSPSYKKEVDDDAEYEAFKAHELRSSLQNKHLFMKAPTFIDSPEWLLKSNQEVVKFMVSFRAHSDCHYLVWQTEALEDVFKQHPNIKQALLGVLGIDISRKVFDNN